MYEEQQAANEELSAASVRDHETMKEQETKILEQAHTIEKLNRELARNRTELVLEKGQVKQALTPHRPAKVL